MIARVLLLLKKKILEVRIFHLRQPLHLHFCLSIIVDGTTSIIKPRTEFLL